MTPADLAKVRAWRRYATLVALAIEGMATVLDEIIYDLHDRILERSCSMPPEQASALQFRHRQNDQCQGAAVPGASAEHDRRPNKRARSVRHHRGKSCPGDAFARASPKRNGSTQPGLRFPAPHRRATPRCAATRREFLDVLRVARPRPPPGRTRRHRGAAQHERQRPQSCPPTATEFINALAKLVMTDNGIDRRYYELCALSEMKNALRPATSGLQGLAPVQGLRGIIWCRPQNSPASNRPLAEIAAGRGHRLRPVPE